MAPLPLEASSCFERFFTAKGWTGPPKLSRKACWLLGTGVLVPVAAPGRKELLRREVSLIIRCFWRARDSCPMYASFQTVYWLVSRFSVRAMTSGCLGSSSNSPRREICSISSAVSKADSLVELRRWVRLSGLSGCATTRPISEKGSESEKDRGQFKSCFNARGSHRSFKVEVCGKGICIGAPSSAIEKVDCCELAADHG